MGERPKFRQGTENKPDPARIQKKFNSDVRSIDGSQTLPESALAEALSRRDIRTIKSDEN